MKNMKHVEVEISGRFNSVTFFTDLPLENDDCVIVNLHGKLMGGKVIDVEVKDILYKVDKDYKKALKQFTYITIEFVGSRNEYIYKTDLDLKVGEQVVVEANRRFEVAKVVKLNVDKPEFETKAVVSRV